MLVEAQLELADSDDWDGLFQTKIDQSYENGNEDDEQ